MAKPPTNQNPKNRTKIVRQPAMQERSDKDRAHLLKRALDHQQTAVVLVDQAKVVQYLNASAETLLSVSSQQAVGGQLNQIFSDPTLSESNWQELTEDEVSVTKRGAQILRKDGTALRADYSLIPVIPDGGVVLELNEIDRRVRIGRDDQFVAAQETTKQLVRGLAHEVKNPLGGIRGAAQLLQRKFNTKEFQQPLTTQNRSENMPQLATQLSEYTEVIIDEVDRLSGLVDRMLGPNQPLQFEPINIHQILVRVERLIVAEADNQISVRRDFDPSLPDIPADKEQLLQAVLNIMRNALQALVHTIDPTISLRTRIERQFTIGTERHRMVLCLDISDNGPGIPDDILDRIFFPMITTRAEGTGLGLAITQNIIGQHNGLLEVESRPGSTRFSIYLPVTQP